MNELFTEHLQVTVSDKTVFIIDIPEKLDQDPGVGHRTQGPVVRPWGEILWWDPRIGLWGGTLGWDLQVGPWRGILGWDHGVGP